MAPGIPPRPPADRCLPVLPVFFQPTLVVFYGPVCRPVYFFLETSTPELDLPQRPSGFPSPPAFRFYFSSEEHLENLHFSRGTPLRPLSVGFLQGKLFCTPSFFLRRKGPVLNEGQCGDLSHFFGSFFPPFRIMIFHASDRIHMVPCTLFPPPQAHAWLRGGFLMRSRF